MAPQARVTSVDALEAFRASLIVYVSKARPALEEVSSDVLRTRLWLQNEQRLHLENQVRRHAKELEQAQQALSSARLSQLRDTRTAEHMAVQKARRSLDEAEAKLKILKRWDREFDTRVEPLLKQLEKLHTLLSHDLVKAVASLAQATQTLQAYADVMPTAAAPTPPPPESSISSEAQLRPESDPAASGVAPPMAPGEEQP